MTATPCAIDGRLTQDGHVCSGCTSRAAGHLAEATHPIESTAHDELFEYEEPSNVHDEGNPQ